VAFHGQAEAGFNDSDAVFTQAGKVAQVGYTLPDGNTLDEITVQSGVAINLFGDVVFHGRTGGDKAVFISDGQTIQVVAKVGDNVDDGTTLSDISDTAGVAINPYGNEVAFHGKFGTTDAVLVGSASPPAPNTSPEADFTFTTDDLTANFEDLSTDSDGDVVAWSWDFGDGNESTEQNPSHTYVAAGIYGVTLTVTDDQGAVSEPASDSVEVTAPLGDVVQVFITQILYDGNLGGLVGADEKCQAAAEEAGLGGTWTAWLSDDAEDAIGRIPDGQYQLVDGTVIAGDKADLTDGMLNAAINLDEVGDPKSGFAWTGTNTSGTNTESNCQNWTDNSVEDFCQPGISGCGDRGVSSATNADWTQISGAPAQCNVQFSLYCFGGGE
jgi:PKD repeat protein